MSLTTTTIMVRCTRCQRTFKAMLPIPGPAVVKPKPRPPGPTVSTNCPHCGAEFKVGAG